MDLSLSEDQQSIEALFGPFFEKECPSECVRAAEPLGFDPELEGLLRELAADPRSQLLRSTRPRTAAGLLERAGAVSPSRAGLTAAERHLLEVHRDELADVLRRACLMRFYSDPARALYLNRSRDAQHAIAFDTPERWRERAREALADARRSPRPLEGLDLLETCLRDEPARPGGRGRRLFDRPRGTAGPGLAPAHPFGPGAIPGGLVPDHEDEGVISGRWAGRGRSWWSRSQVVSTSPRLSGFTLSVPGGWSHVNVVV